MTIKRMRNRKNRHHRFRPQQPGVAIFCGWRSHDESNVKLTVPHRADDVDCSPFAEFYADARMLLTVSRKQVGKETADRRQMQTDAQTSFIPSCQCACRLHRMIEMDDSRDGVFNEIATSLR